MNKSILLVMCDMLVLSVMSLSSGGFFQGESGSRGEVVEVVPQKDYMDLKQRLEEAEKRADDAKDGEENAWEEVIRAQDAAAEATADADAARTAAMKAKAELAEIRARQAALTGTIPQQLSWQVVIHCKNGEKRQVHSPLVEIGNRHFVFFEWKRLGVKSIDDVAEAKIRQGDIDFRGTVCRVARLPNLAFVEITPGEKLKSIGFGVVDGYPPLDDNIVYRPQDGSCEGNPVPCESGPGNNLYCSVKTENRSIPQQVRGDHSVDEGCFLLSKSHGCVAAIVGKKTGAFSGERKCEILRPIAPEELGRHE